MKSLKERVAQLYYTHGLFCASHPLFVIFAVIFIALLACYPLTNLPLPGNAPVEVNTAIKDYEIPLASVPNDGGKEELKKQRWYLSPPVAYVQQIVVKATVSPWEPKDMVPIDAFRAPLAKVFDILENINNFKHTDGTTEHSVSDFCLRVGEVLSNSRVKGLLPEYNCLVVSPANFWRKDFNSFKSDPEILKTVNKMYGQALETSPTLQDLLLGIPWKKTGISRYFIRNRQRTISYAVTIMFKSYNQRFVESLRQRLEEVYPDSTGETVNTTEIQYMVHVQYKDINYFVEYTPLLVTYFVLLLYIYFSVRKIEMVKSKWGLAISAVITVIASLLMSVSICTLFGMTPTLNGGEIFPYLVVIIGLENVLVLTKSVVSTPVHLDVKYRVAQGLSKEGWSITKNLVAELLIILVGFFTFVPAIQEFCLFAVVGLLSDFFLQIIFFVTILSVDIRRMELSDLHKQSIHQEMLNSQDDVTTFPTIEPLIRCPIMTRMAPTPLPEPPAPPARIQRSKSALGLYKIAAAGGTPPSPPSPTCTSSLDYTFFPSPTILPRRLKFIYFWARTRMFQRAIMVCTVVWIALIVYKSGLVEKLASATDSLAGDQSATSIPGFESSPKGQGQIPGSANQHPHHGSSNQNWPHDPENFLHKGHEEDEILGQAEHSDLELWRQLSFKHWRTLFRHYNISLSGRHVSILPSIHLTIKVPPEEAVKMRLPLEVRQLRERRAKSPQTPPPQKPDQQENDAQTGGNGPQKTETNVEDPYRLYNTQNLKLYYPQSGKEFAITVVLAVLSVPLVVYFMMILYKCMCSRNYDKWRSSWAKRPRRLRAGKYFKQIKDAVPLILKGHSLDIECLCVDGPLIASTCLGGQLRVWDSNSGDCLTLIQRRCVTPPMHRKPCLGRNIEDSDADLYAEYHGDDQSLLDIEISADQSDRQTKVRHRDVARRSSATSNRNLFENQPDLTATIDTQFLDASSTLSSASSVFIEPLSPNNAATGTTTSTTTDSNSNLNNRVSSSSTVGSESGYDFSQFDPLYAEHHMAVAESRAHSRFRNSSLQGEEGNYEELLDNMRARSWSAGSTPPSMTFDPTLYDQSGQTSGAPIIWSLACQNNLIVAGCGNGRLEFWDGLTGALKYLYEDSKHGVTSLCFNGNRVMAARLTGDIDFLELETFKNMNTAVLMPSQSSTALHNRGHMRHGSSHSDTWSYLKSWDDIIHCSLIETNHAHQQPINSLQSVGGRIVSASTDNTLKVFRQEDYVCLYTLHGHTAGVTVLYLDKGPPYAAASGSVDGTVRLWDLVTGVCVHQLKGHGGTITMLTCTSQLVVSSGQDDHLCVWERSHGQLIHRINNDVCGLTSVAMMTSNLLVTGAESCVCLWDVTKGEMLRKVMVGSPCRPAFVNSIHIIGNATVVCDYGNEIRVIHFPTVLEKAD